MGHRWGTGPRKYANTSFHCTAPRGLIRWITIGALDHESMLLQVFIVLPQGGSFVGSPLGHWTTKVCYHNFSLCYPKGAHSLGHRLGTAPRKYAITIFHCATPRWFIRGTTVGALCHESMLLQFYNVLPQGGSLFGSPLGHQTTKKGISLV